MNHKYKYTYFFEDLLLLIIDTCLSLIVAMILTAITNPPKWGMVIIFMVVFVYLRLDSLIRRVNNKT